MCPFFSGFCRAYFFFSVAIFFVELEWGKVCMERSPHYSRIADAPESINPITGRSLYYGLRPWRCDDRFMDWLNAFTNLANPKTQYQLLALMRKCAKSDVGKEPIDDYLYLTRRETMYYVERRLSGMIRERVFETYPYSSDALRKAAEQDAMKMRVWRNQRQLELEAKEGKIDELLVANVLGSSKRPKSE